MASERYLKTSYHSDVILSAFGRGCPPFWGGSFGAWGPPGEGIKGEGISNITRGSQHANGPRAGEFQDSDGGKREKAK